jgi:hypothetical protein
MTFGVYRHLASEVTGNGHGGQRGDKRGTGQLLN